MNRIASIILTCAVFSIMGTVVYAQSIENVKASFESGKVVVVYDLVHPNPALYYRVELQGSYNDYTAPLQSVSGDVGEKINPGIGKRIEWDAQADLGRFNGEIAFKVKATMALAFKNFENAVVRRGKTTAVEWYGSDDHPVRMELYKGSERIQTFSEIKNNGRYTWQVPPNMKTGDDYSWKISKGAAHVVSDPFTVKPKIPHWLKALPAVAVGGIIAVLGGGGEAGGDEGNLPAAPEPR